MAVAFVALLAALTGTAVALPGTNSVDSGDIKNSQVKTQDIKNSTIAGKDVKSNTITGSDVNESSLGKVPSATAADSATTATTATNATNAVNATNAANAGTLDGVDSTGYVKVNAARIRAVSDTSADVDYANDANLAQLSNLAAGQYSVTGKLQVDNDTAADEVIDCDLIRNSGVLTQIDTSEQNLGDNAAGAQELNYVFTGTFTAGAAGTDDLFLRCEQQGGDNDADEMRIVAVLAN
jgi:uncharacterized secreted protein with C-terminal beta-propeller domain